MDCTICYHSFGPPCINYLLAYLLSTVRSSQLVELLLVMALRVCRKVNIVDTMFKMLEKYSTDLEEIVRVRTIALEEERKKTENLLSQMLPALVVSSYILTQCSNQSISQ